MCEWVTGQDGDNNSGCPMLETITRDTYLRAKKTYKKSKDDVKEEESTQVWNRGTKNHLDTLPVLKDRQWF